MDESMKDTTAASAAAWEAFCESLKKASAVLTRTDMVADSRHAGIGARYLGGLLDSALDLYLHAADPDRPFLFTYFDNHRGWGLANPDGHYLRARLRGDATYRVWGKRGTIPYLGFELSRGIWSYTRPTRIDCSLSGRDLQLGPDGSFEIILSANAHAGNWLRLEPDVEWLHVRQFYHDWIEDEPPRVFIERIDRDPGAPEPTVAEIAERLRDVAWFVEEESRLWADYCLHMRGVLGVNVMPQPSTPGGNEGDMTAASGAPENQYSQGYYRIDAGSALLVEFEPPRAAYWNLQIGPMWYESLDPAQRIQSWNDRQAFVGSDGVFRAVLAHRDPGVPNWLDTGGFDEGVMLCRFQFPECTAPQPRTRVVPLASLAHLLPPDTPRVGPDERRRDIARRRHGLAMRFR